MYAAVVIFVVPAVLISAFIWRGYVLSVIWGWVMVSHFGAPGMSIPVAIAFSTMVSMLTTSKAGNELEDEQKVVRPACKGIFDAVAHPVRGVGGAQIRLSPSEF